MLPPICEKLGIDVPELYLQLNVNPNAYTYGDTEPFIVITSGLLETVPDELIPTILAHECGHIACHHTLYTTMGNLILNGANILGLNELASIPIQVAFHYWMRCSEFSAVRAYEAKEWTESENFEKLMKYIANENVDEDEIKDLPFSESSKYYLGKDYLSVQLDLQLEGFEHIEFIRITEKNILLKEGQVTKITKDNEEEFNIGEWYSSDRKIIITYYQPLSDDEIAALHPNEIRVPDSSKKFIERNFEEVVVELQDAGFTEIIIDEQKVKKGIFTKENSISKITIAGVNQFERGTWFKPDFIVRITYNSFI